MDDDTQHIENLTNQYFQDCINESQSVGTESLSGWLWFTCPAHLRTPVREAITTDRRFTP